MKAPLRPKILVVDDELAITRAMSWELKGFDVRLTTSLSAALLALSREEFDAVVCDWNLADECGERVLRVAAKLSQKARRFIVSAVVPEDLGPLLSSGLAHRYIAKPWRPYDVRDAVREELEC
jgi:DNA-binding response OmpR family regulator